MPLPKPNPEEKQNDFVSRCVSFVKHDDPSTPQDQAVAMCYTQWRRFKGGQKPKEFNFFTPITKTWEEIMDKDAGTKQRFIEVTISGLKEDRDGEMMSKEAILDMITQLKSGTVPFFPNHGKNPMTGEREYKWQDMMGVWVDGFQVDENLKAVVRLNNSHPDSDLFWGYIKEGMPIGFSIGGRPLEEPKEVEVDDEEKN